MDAQGFSFSVWSHVFAATSAVPHHLCLLSKRLNRFRISSVLENRDTTYLNELLCRYQMLAWEITLGNAVKSNFLINVTIP